MGLFEAAAEAVTAKVGDSAGQHNIISSILGLIEHPDTGGLTGMVDKFRSAGLSNIVNGWISNGPNPPVSPDQLQQVFSMDQLRGFAQKLGLNTDEATKHLADLLPGIVDHLTPNGALPAGGINTASILAALKAKLAGSPPTT